MSPELRTHLPAAMAFVLPILFVKGATLFMGDSAPQTAIASVAPKAQPIAATTPVAAAPKMSEKQITAASYVESLRQHSFGPPPFLFERSNSAPKVEETPTDVDPIPDSIGPMPTFTLSAVMSAASGRRALINGTPYREGDTISDTTWVIDAIDINTRSVTLRDTNSDRTTTVAVETPQ